MNPFVVPDGLKQWETRIGLVVAARPLPPTDEASPASSPWVKARSICELACMEMLDGEPSPGELAMWYQELRCRGMSESHLQQLRKFLWLTAGWLNFEMKRWEWNRLDENDVERAIDLQLQKGLIDEPTAADMRAYFRELLIPAG